MNVSVMIMNWGNTGASTFKKSGKKATKNRMAFGFVAAIRNPSLNLDKDAMSSVDELL